MNILLLAGIGLAGGLGAAARFVMDGAVRSRVRTPLPVSTIAVNVAGSLLLGLLTGLVLRFAVPVELQLMVGVGFLGAFTTFSTASVETVWLLQARHPWLAMGNLLGTWLATVMAAAAGLALSGLF